jgi:hypothetical protein
VVARPLKATAKLRQESRLSLQEQMSQNGPEADTRSEQVKARSGADKLNFWVGDLLAPAT